MSAPEHGEPRALQGSAALTDPLSAEQNRCQHATAAAAEWGGGERGPAPQQPGIAGEGGPPPEQPGIAGEGGPPPEQPGIAVQQQNGVSGGVDAEQDNDRRDSNNATSTSGHGKECKL